MVQVKLKVSRAGDTFSQQPGEIVEMDEAEARRHIQRGMAVLVAGELLDEPSAAAPETADRPTPQTATIKPSRRKPRP